MTEEHTLYSATEAGTIADLARDSAKADLHVVETKSGSTLLQQDIFGRGASGELVHVDTIDVAGIVRDHAAKGPDRLAGTVQVHTPDTLVAYAARHLHADTTTLWGDVENARLTVIFNDHGDQTEDSPGWGDHRTVLDLKPSPEWQAWTRLNEKGMSQEELAEFLEEHLLEVVDPDGSTLLEVTRTFQATTGATFRRAQSLHSGQVQITWQEEGEAKAGTSGQLEVPREFTIRVRPFVGTSHVDVKGMFRYRVSSGSLQLGFRLLNLDEHRRAAVEDILGDVSTDLTLQAFEGIAPTARR